MCLSRCQQRNIEQNIGPFCQEQMCQGTFQYIFTAGITKNIRVRYLCVKIES